MTEAREFFLQYSGLKPAGYREAGLGVCGCQPRRVPLYRKGVVIQCGACVRLRQEYPMGIDRKPLRLGLGCYLLITPTQVRFWGNHLMDLHNPDIICETATGRMASVYRRFVMSPPTPPWMLIGFGRATSADTLRVNTNDRVMRFSGDTDIIGRTEISEFNRLQVMDMFQAGLSRAEWDAYLDAYYRGTVEDIASMRKLEEKHPNLTNFAVLPPRSSAEHLALRWLLSAEKPTSKAA